MYTCMIAMVNHILALQIEKIKLPSEEKDNPITDIRFYRKPKGDGSHVELLTKKEVQEMVNYNIACIIL